MTALLKDRNESIPVRAKLNIASVNDFKNQKLRSGLSVGRWETSRRREGCHELLPIVLLLLKLISERCGGLDTGAVMLNKCDCGSGYKLAFALLRIRLSSLDAILQDKKNNSNIAMQIKSICSEFKITLF